MSVRYERQQECGESKGKNTMKARKTRHVICSCYVEETSELEFVACDEQLAKKMEGKKYNRSLVGDWSSTQIILSAIIICYKNISYHIYISNNDTQNTNTNTKN